MTLAEQDQLGRELTDINKRLAKLEGTIEKLLASRAIHMDSVGTPKASGGNFEVERDPRLSTRFLTG